MGNGRRSDECFAKYINWTSHGHKLTLVLEEDVIFKEDMMQFDFEPIAALIHDASREWEVLRLTWYDHNNEISNGCRNTNVRSCSQWVEQNMCTIPSCALHSSAAYMIPAKSYDRFLTGGGGAIDGQVLNQ